MMMISVSIHAYSLLVTYQRTICVCGLEILIALLFCFFCYLSFLFTNNHESRNSRGEGGGYLLNSSGGSPPALQALRH